MAVGAQAYAQAPHYDVEATLLNDPLRVRVQTNVTFEVAAGDDVTFWLYAARTLVQPQNLDDRNWRWIFPGNLSLASLHWHSLQIDGQSAHFEHRRRDLDARGIELVPTTPLREGKHSARFVYEFILPERFGRIGSVGDRVSLTGPWYPLVTKRGTLIDNAHHDIRADADVPFLVGNQPTLRGDTVSIKGLFAPLTFDEDLRRRATRLLGHNLVVYSSGELDDPPDWAGTHRIPTHALLRETLEEALVAARFFGLRVPRDTTITLVPSRTELAATAPGQVLISNRVFELFPLEDFRDFHRRAIKRALYRHWLMRGAMGRAQTSLEADLRAVALSELDQIRRAKRAKTPRDLLEWASFNPAVDNLLHARQVPFVNEYFGIVDDADPFRSPPEYAYDPHSSGKRVFEMARDSLDAESFASFRTALLSDREPIERVLDQLGVMPSQFANWVNAGRTRVNYRIVDVRAHDGHTTVTFERQGDTRIEPVTVLVEAADGTVHQKTWNGSAKRGELTFENVQDVDDVILDPGGRLVQSADVAGGHPRGDDATTHPWRPPLLRGFGLNLLVSENDFSGFVDFAMRRRFNLEEAFTFTASHAPSGTGGAVRYVRGFGPKLHGNARSASASIGVEFDHLAAGFAEDQSSAYRPSLLAGIGTSTYRFAFDPRDGYSVGASGRFGVAFLESGRVQPSASLGARASIGISADLRHLTLLVGSVGVSINPQLAAEYQGVGGRFGLRAYETSELLGRAKAYAVAEHRFTLFTDLSWNVAHLVWIREVQLAAFAGAGLVIAPREGGTARAAAEVGGGIRFHFEYGGVQPGVLSLDWALPLIRDPNGTGSDGVLGSQRPPLGFYLSFDQYF